MEGTSVRTNSGGKYRTNLGPQQPEEGYSNFLWVAVCAFIEYLELDITFWAPMLGFACGSLLLYFVFRTLRRDFGMGLGVAFPITLGLGLSPPYALWSTGGLGTIAFALSTFATAYFLVLRPAGIAPYRGALAGVATAYFLVVAYGRHCLGFAHRLAGHRHPTDERGSGLASNFKLGGTMGGVVIYTPLTD